MSERSHRVFLEKDKQVKQDIGQIWENILIWSGQ